MYARAVLGLGLAWFAISGCDAVDDDGSSDRGGDADLSCGDGGRCGIGECTDAGTDAVEWSDAIAVGGSAEEAFGSVEGSCEAPFTWDGAGWEPNRVEPPSGQTTVTVRVELDRQSARLGHVDSGGRTGPGCEDVLSVEGHASVRTADGAFDDEADVTLQYRESHGPSTFGFQVALEDLGGTLAVELEGDARGSLGYTLSGADAACAGDVRLNITTSRDGIGMASSGTLASWSSSGCPVGEVPFDANEPAAEGETPIADAIAAAWSDASYPGEWDDGSPTELNVRVEVPNAAGCREDGGAVLIPVRATYGTADGRIEEHAADATVRAGLGPNDETLGLELWIDDLLRCEDPGGAIPYTLAGCDELESVQIQLGIHSNGGEISFSDSGLNAYESRRDGTAAPGAADVLRTLLLMQND
jgi:hypothetical protein